MPVSWIRHGRTPESSSLTQSARSADRDRQRYSLPRRKYAIPEGLRDTENRNDAHEEGIRIAYEVIGLTSRDTLHAGLGC